MLTLPAGLRPILNRTRVIATLAATCLAGAASCALAQEDKPVTTVSVSLPNDPLLVQVNQVALESTGPKQAIVESRGKAAGGSFRVLTEGCEVLRGELSPLPEFIAWAADKHYFGADFSSLSSPGTYRLEVTLGDQRVLSAPVRVDERALFSQTAAGMLDYFRRSRHVGEGDRHIRVFDSKRHVDVWGGWKDAGGDTGKYLSHLGYANHFNPQQASMAAWVLAYTASAYATLYRDAGLLEQAEEEALWGADYLHRILDPEGYFYTTVFDRWGSEGAERMVVGYAGAEGTYNSQYRSAFRAGGGMAIAALARASMLAGKTQRRGEFDGQTYLADAIRAFDHLQRFNRQYCADGVENIIDDYTALMATVELFNATGQARYLDAARVRAGSLMARLDGEGGFISDGKQRPYYHAVEAGLPVLSLAYYLEIEPDSARQDAARIAIASALEHQVKLTHRVSNPYDYARQRFQLATDGKAAGKVMEGFFIPHQNETGYWWQGESARLASLSAAMIVGGSKLAQVPEADHDRRREWAEFAQHQIDWTLGRNPYGISMLYGFGQRNPPTVASSAGDMFAGGISNGITGAVGNAAGNGIAFAPGPDGEQWRWVEQWLPHTTWMLLAATVMADQARH